jgi:hypothetical protein
MIDKHNDDIQERMLIVPGRRKAQKKALIEIMIMTTIDILVYQS